MERKYAKEAKQFCAYIKEIASKQENLDNLETYLSFHFADWLKRFASTPADMVADMREFATMDLTK